MYWNRNWHEHWNTEIHVNWRQNWLTTLTYSEGKSVESKQTNYWFKSILDNLFPKSRYHELSRILATKACSTSTHVVPVSLAYPGLSFLQDSIKMSHVVDGLYRSSVDVLSIYPDMTKLKTQEFVTSSAINFPSSVNFIKLYAYYSTD